MSAGKKTEVMATVSKLNILREVPVTNCKPKSVHVPTQERLHRKKCLLPDEEPLPSLPSYAEAPQPTYG